MHALCKTCGETLKGRNEACNNALKLGCDCAASFASRELEEDLKVIKAIHQELVLGGGGYSMGWKIANLNRWRIM